MGTNGPMRTAGLFIVESKRIPSITSDVLAVARHARLRTLQESSEEPREVVGSRRRAVPSVIAEPSRRESPAHYVLFGENRRRVMRNTDVFPSPPWTVQQLSEVSHEDLAQYLEYFELALAPQLANRRIAVAELIARGLPNKHRRVD